MMPENGGISGSTYSVIPTSGSFEARLPSVSTREPKRPLSPTNEKGDGDGGATGANGGDAASSSLIFFVGGSSAIFKSGEETTNGRLATQAKPEVSHVVKCLRLSTDKLPIQIQMGAMTSAEPLHFSTRSLNAPLSSFASCLTSTTSSTSP